MPNLSTRKSKPWFFLGFINIILTVEIPTKVARAQLFPAPITPLNRARDEPLISRGCVRFLKLICSCLCRSLFASGYAVKSFIHFFTRVPISHIYRCIPACLGKILPPISQFAWAASGYVGSENGVRFSYIHNFSNMASGLTWFSYIHSQIWQQNYANIISLVL